MSEERREPRVEQRQTFQQIGDLGFGVIAGWLGADTLTGNVGRSSAVLDFGMRSFRARCNDLGLSVQQIEQAAADADLAFRIGRGLCESPIERDVLAGLILARWNEGFGTIPPKVHTRSEDLLPAGDIIIVPQMAFARFRVDFMLALRAGEQQQLVAVECDGAEFHRNVAKDKLRDAYLHSWQIQVFHISGKEIVAEASDAIAPVVNWANDWRAKR